VGRIWNRSAVIFERSLPNSTDPYSQQQATAADSMLKKLGFALIGGEPLKFPVDNNKGYIEGTEAGSTVCPSPSASSPSVVYLAGRSDDLPGLMTFIRDNASCFSPHVIVLSGDDLTKNEYIETRNAFLPAGVTLYYVAFTNIALTGHQSGLEQDPAIAFSLSISPAVGSQNLHSNQPSPMARGHSPTTPHKLSPGPLSPRMRQQGTTRPAPGSLWRCAVTYPLAKAQQVRSDLPASATASRSCRSHHRRAERRTSSPILPTTIHPATASGRRQSGSRAPNLRYSE
jgi:hypothetical protein